MNLSQLSNWQNLLRYHPAPWYLEQLNDKGVEVKDGKGSIIFYEDFGSIPDEMRNSTAEEIRNGSVALALWLVAMSENEDSHSQPSRTWEEFTKGML